MSIQNTRQHIITEKLLKENLQKGILPNSKEFIWQLNQAMRQAGQNSSAFRFKPFKEGSIAYSDVFNNYHDVIQEDLKVLYDNLSDLYFSNNKEYQYFLTEKEKLEREINILENDLRFYVQNNQRAQMLPYAYDTFDNTEKVNIEASRNVLVDTKNNSVKLIEEKNTTRRVFPESDISFNVYPERLVKKQRTITGTKWNTLQNEEDKIWQQEVRIKKEQPVTAILQYEFKEQWYINQIDLSFLTVKPFQLYATYSLDGIEWFDMPNYVGSFQVEKDVSLNFPSIPMRYFRLEFIKNQADEIIVEEDEFNYHYLFGMHHIRFYHKQYPVSGELVSLPLEFQSEPENYAIQTIRLHTDEYIPTGTSIQYDIALASETELNWQPIDPINRKNPANPQNISMMRMSNNNGEEIYFNPNYSSKQAEAEDLLANGIPVYRLTQFRENKEYFYILPRQLRENSLSLYVGNNSWEIKSFPSDDVYGIPKIDDFMGVYPETQIWYQSLKNDHNGYILQNHTEGKQKKYMIRLALYLTESRTVTSRPISTDPFAVYLNNDLLLETDTDNDKDIHFALKAGWNEIVILVNGQNTITTNGLSLLLGFQPSRISDTIYSRSKPLQEVSLFDLRYNTKRHDRTVFAKRKIEEGWEILTNFWYPGLAFQLFYEYKSDDLPKEEKLLLRARFQREDGLNIPTPVLRNYRIECT